jgi:hypothetical protein
MGAPGEMGDGRESAQGARSAREHAEALELTVPQQILDAIPPRPPGFGSHRELFPRTTGERFDPLSPATIAADVTIGFVLQTDRAVAWSLSMRSTRRYQVLKKSLDRLTKAGVRRAHGDALRGPRSVEPRSACWWIA